MLDAAGLKPGDVAGLALFNRPYAWIGVSVDADGPALAYVTEEGGRVTRVPLARNARVAARRRATSSPSRRASATAPTARGSSRSAIRSELVFQLKTFQGVRYSLFAFGSGGRIRRLRRDRGPRARSARADGPDPVRARDRAGTAPGAAAAALEGGPGDTSDRRRAGHALHGRRSRPRTRRAAQRARLRRRSAATGTRRCAPAPRATARRSSGSRRSPAS